MLGLHTHDTVEVFIYYFLPPDYLFLLCSSCYHQTQNPQFWLQVLGLLGILYHAQWSCIFLSLLLNIVFAATMIESFAVSKINCFSSNFLVFF